MLLETSSKLESSLLAHLFYRFPKHAYHGAFCEECPSKEHEQLLRKVRQSMEKVNLNMEKKFAKTSWKENFKRRLGTQE